MKPFAQKILRPGPLFVLAWLIGYVIWAYFVPASWDIAIQDFLLKNRLGFEHYRSFVHAHAEMLMITFSLALAVLISGWLLFQGGRRAR